ncbi:MAG: transketolase [Acidimicrobiaceae bacterium]|nr:transketolase [Acidimicrobiaceae bacterium]
MTNSAKGESSRGNAKIRCRNYRRKILDISQKVSALHIAPAFSCTEIVDAIYNEVMRIGSQPETDDIFLMSKGHGCMIQYVILEERGVLSSQDLELYCKPAGRLGAHPDYGIPGIAASTGSLGHGLGIAVGQAYAEYLKGTSLRLFCVLSDGELQEGSTWEAMLMAGNLKLNNLVAVVDNNDFTGLERMSTGHPAFYPLIEKGQAFGWDVEEVNGHDSLELVTALKKLSDKPRLIIARTVKGKGVGFMESEPIWHYRSPSGTEYEQAIRELESDLS